MYLPAVVPQVGGGPATAGGLKVARVDAAIGVAVVAVAVAVAVAHGAAHEAAQVGPAVHGGHRRWRSAAGWRASGEGLMGCSDSFNR